MNNYQISGFDVIDADNLSDYYEAQISFQNHTVRLDINFDEYTIDQLKLEAIENFVANLNSYHQKAVEAMQQDILTGDVVKHYIKEHEPLFAKYREADSKSGSEAEEIAGLYLKRIGFYPENENQFAVFDYTIDEKSTQYLVVANFKRDGEIDNLTMES